MSLLNPNLVNLFNCKPKTLTWTIELYSKDNPITSSSFGDFQLKFFKNCQIVYSGDNDHQQNVFSGNYYFARYPVICLICRDTSNPKVTVFTRISILNAKGEKCDTQEGRVNFYKRETKSGGVYQFNLDDFVINGKLTIFCEVYVLDEQTISSGFNGDSVLAILSDQKKLLESGKFSDFVISVGGKEFKVHKNILGSRSPVFAAMFEHTDTKEALEGRVEIEDTQSVVFEQFLQYLYTGKSSKLEEYAEELLALSEKYQVSSLKSLCSHQLSSTLAPESVGKLLYLADLYLNEELKSNCVQFIKQFADKIDWEAFKLAIANCSADLCFELFKLSITKK